MAPPGCITIPEILRGLRRFCEPAFANFFSVTSVFLCDLRGQLLMFLETKLPVFGLVCVDSFSVSPSLRGEFLIFLIFPLLTPLLCVGGFCLWLRLCPAVVKQQLALTFLKL